VLHRYLADAVLLAHVAFVAFAMFGALLARRWRWVPIVHVPALAWGSIVELTSGTCPLTPLEQTLRRAAGEAGYSGGFLEHYVLALLYPSALTPATQLVLGCSLLALNVVLYGWVLWPRHP